MNKDNGKPLRFGPLVRVSTEKQEQQGESLRTQKTQNRRDVELLGGSIAEWYGGQEHATAGWEKKELDRLIADAGKGKFDAVMVAHADRWSRDNAKSTEGLDAFKRHGIRFFVSVTEYDLFNPEHVLFLDLSSVIGKFQASNQNKKSILNRIARARRGIPTATLPFGRTFDKETSQWGTDPAKKALIEDVAARYLAGEQMPKLAKEFGINHSGLCKTLRECCGERWELHFRVDAMGIDETVAMMVPRLLPEGTIRAVRQRLEANRTYLHGNPSNDYLLSGRIFCSVCGYSLFGQVARGHTYYRHAHTERARECPLDPRPWVRADKIEQAVISDLFKLFGNPAAIERAVKAAVPDCDKALKRRGLLEEELAKIDRARNRLLDLIEKDAITDEQATGKLRDLKDRENALRRELDTIADALANVPDAETIRCYVQQDGDAIFVYDDNGNHHYEGGNSISSYLAMSREDHRALIDSTFNAMMPDGKPAGVYITPNGGEEHGSKRFNYELKGRLTWRVTPRSLPSTSPAPTPPARSAIARPSPRKRCS